MFSHETVKKCYGMGCFGVGYVWCGLILVWDMSFLVWYGLNLVRDMFGEGYFW